MTKNNPLKINSIAVIGGGPSGITSLYDLTRALKNGHSLYGVKDIHDYETSKRTAFDEVVLFERNSDVGGVWCRSERGMKNEDPELPDFSISPNYEDPEQIFVKAPISKKLDTQLNNSSFKDPVFVTKKEKQPEDKYQWRSSAAYEHLFTNVPNKYMSFSYKSAKQLSKNYKQASVFESADEVGDYLNQIVEENNLKKNIRFNSNVERILKLENGQWEVTVRVTESQIGTSNLADRWYKQTFDAVVIANGKTIPIIPRFKNLEEFTRKTRGKTYVTSAKAIKDPKILKDAKKILFIGSSVSAIDLIQYAFPRSIEKPSVFISRRSEAKLGHDWVEFCSHSKGIVNKPEVEEFLPENQGVRFKDGTQESEFDVVIFATGYHIYYPFLEKEYVLKHQKLLKFFLYTFSIEDPSLALIGNTYAVFFFNRVECQAAALAGVWSGSKELPSKEEQVEWYKSDFGQKLLTYHVKERFMDPLISYALQDRPHPFNTKDTEEHVAEISQGRRILEGLFQDIRTGKVDPLTIVN
ncbi:hypothetical protein FOA43_001611 [Brettanomyces nanus]|uniref:Thiol-specific monooxygenase n=1 Tax=Eeniella nana TaxID=13502 RepID=A0A875RYQ6_EENNA|nr:uncharacterized protein FOA43_001611 [Brettanomyces nanus]QPG74286.1 hypothetical protein FOA43_001611 [Brettanomyces nanus]